MYQAVQAEWSTFVSRVAVVGQLVPRFCEREAAAFLRCGILGHGFARVHCDDCGQDDVVAFSCKGRGFCPSCGTRRMVDTASFLVDCVIPEVTVRQWVLSMPYLERHDGARPAVQDAYAQRPKMHVPQPFVEGP